MWLDAVSFMKETCFCDKLLLFRITFPFLNQRTVGVGEPMKEQDRGSSRKIGLLFPSPSEDEV
jgi:hypothetical protein